MDLIGLDWIELFVLYVYRCSIVLCCFVLWFADASLSVLVGPCLSSTPILPTAIDGSNKLFLAAPEEVRLQYEPMESQMPDLEVH